MTLKKPTFSILIELENSLLAEADRCRTMFEVLAQQINLNPHIFEIVVIFDPSDVEVDWVSNFVSDHFTAKTGKTAAISIQLLPVQDCHYYELKNAGAKAAQGDYVVFLDSDVIPAEHWLEEMTRPFTQRSDIKILCGSPFIPTNSIYNRAFATGWFFQLKPQTVSPIFAGDRFFANSVAFERDLFLNNPFPTLPQGISRGACAQLSRGIKLRGETIWVNEAAQVEHPAPNGLRHFWLRALCNGKDQALKRNNGVPEAKNVASLMRWFYTNTRYSFRRIFKSRREAGISLLEMPLTLAIMGGYYLIGLFAGLFALIFPDYAKRHWQV